MNPYYSNWNYGSTLMPSSDQSRGAYQTYENSASDPNQYYYQNTIKKEPGDVKMFIPSTSNSSAGPSIYLYQGWQKPVSTDKNQPKFVSSSSNLKSQSGSTAGPSIGPVKPEPMTLQQPSKDLDPTTAIQQVHELAVANRLVERYDTLEKPVPGKTENNKLFLLKLFIGAETYEGKSENIRGAKQLAALMCLQNTKYRTSKEQKLTMFKTADRSGMTATSELHNIAAQKKIQIDFKFLEPFNFEYKASMKMWSKKEMLGNYRVQLNVGGYEFYGQAELPQQAKHNAATQALDVIRKIPDNKGEAKLVAKPGKTSEELKEEGSTEVTSANKNVIMLLHEVAIAHSITPEWNLISEAGPQHAKVFTTELKLGEFATIGSGANKKTARQNAADQMWANLPDDWKKKAKQSMHRKNKNGNFRGGYLGKRKFGETGGPLDSKKMATPGAIEITSNNPISSLFEFACKTKIPPPTFTVVNETVIGQGNLNNRNQTTFKKIEFTIQCEIAGKKFIASGLNKKGIKTTAAMEAWDTIKRENKL